MRAAGRIIKRVGICLAVLGLAIIVLHIFLGGPWPEFLRPFQTVFTYFDGWDYIGKAIEGAIFVGPGVILYLIGEALESRKGKHG